ncbi:PHB depolymerase family esterase [Actinosynnema sp. NPDC020468]|uniref:extracellular catalytic domain type 1 short-chain-length polyhydroxyalkanoate depolymerase n=1 Tax=Actinosynnema sp. NPDC020468 TaxID=3154488 RepID=UPI0033D10C3C
MRTLIVLLLLLAGCSPARPTTSPDHEHHVTSGGIERTYRVHVPAGASGRLPVVVLLHGGGGDGEQVARQTGMSAAADRAGFAVVYPDGTGRTALLSWNAGRCCAYAQREHVDDVAFLSTVLDEVLAGYPVDPTRVFVTGMSNGAMMAYRLGCERSDRIAAIAPVSGALNVDPCTPTRPLSVLAIHGTADEAVPYQGGTPIRQPTGTDPWVNTSVADSIGFWARHDHCAGRPEDTRTGAVTVTRQVGCADDRQVVLYTVDGGGHAWPGGTTTRTGADPAPPLPIATDVVLDFFAHVPGR